MGKLASGSAAIVGRLSLDLRLSGEPPARTRRIAQSLSGVDRVGECLFLGSDEGAGLERLEAGGGGFRNRQEFLLDTFFELPGASRVEADIESISVHKDWLWLVTSHALTRRRIKKGLETFAEITPHSRRYVLGRIPLVRKNGEVLPVPRDGDRHAECVPLSETGSALTDALKHDPYLKHFLAIPAKENGLDIEGLAARGSRVVLGLRGPVLRGHAVLLDMMWPEGNGGFGIEADGQRYRRLFVDLDGLGVRDLCRRGRDLILLAGPTMPLPAPYRLFALPGFFDEAEPEPILEPECLCEIPSDEGNPEGITRYEKPDTFLVAFDSVDSEDATRARGLLIRPR